MRSKQKAKKWTRKHGAANCLGKAGGKPSTWFPPGRLVKQSGVKDEWIYKKRLEGNGTKKQREEAGEIDKNSKMRAQTREHKKNQEKEEE